MSSRKSAVSRKSRSSALSTDPLLALLERKEGAAGERFRGRGVVVTGGASGIGRAIALGFALAGARVTILDLDRKKGAQTLKLLRKFAPQSRFVPADLCKPADVERAAKVFAGPAGADILINNAAMLGRLAPVHELEASAWGRVAQANLLAPARLSQLLARNLIARGRKGTIINVLTIQTVLPVPNYSAYIASKGGLDALTLSMAVDLAPFGIRVNGIRVGCILTENYLSVLPPALKRQVDAGVDATRLLDQRAATLLNRMGRPAEIAKVALFLASDGADFLTGSIIRADGGRAISRKVEPLL
jgi:NAD(P)-dependent dehydrogenase (short-subunit alcohol dehydrogenase family)